MYRDGHDWLGASFVTIVFPFLLYILVQNVVIAGKAIEGNGEPKDFANVFLMGVFMNIFIVADTWIVQACLSIIAPRFGDLMAMLTRDTHFYPALCFLAFLNALSTAVCRSERSAEQLKSIESLKRNWKLYFPPMFFFYTIWRWPARQVFSRYEWIRDNVFPSRKTQ